MITNRIRNRAIAAVFSVTIAGLGAGALGAGTASASDYASEASFLEEISINGATLPGLTAEENIAAGHAVCADLTAGGSILDEISALEQTYQFESGVLFLSASTTNLCPNFAG
ncbi:DUF732 domain-containing protein [Antrihabitans spumae]|jgi:hypothetical protein|uniref:DUF732 domain-containing protein n=1 Tax=Antrihabitans spumae TaxID=3373370 RepID=A0ABW7KL59_9NOCA